MKTNIKILHIVLFLFASLSLLTAQTLDEIIDLHLKAHGGVEKWDEIESMKITGNFTAFSIEDDFMAIKTKDGKYYSELSLGKNRVIESFDGEKGWTIDPWHEILFPRELNNDEINVFLQKSEFFSPFYKYKERGIEIELLGKENFEGTDVWKIKVTRPNGKYETWFLDTDTYLAVKSNSYWVDFGYPAPAATFFDDYRNFNGLVIPCYVERTFYQRDRILIIDDIIFNVDVDENLFCMPKSKQIEKLEWIIGDWDVIVNAFSPRANRWYNIDTTTSEIEFEANNMITEEFSYTQVFVKDFVINYTYNSIENEYLVTIFDGFSANLGLFTGAFVDSTFVVTNKIAECDSITVPTDKFIYTNTGKNTFEINISNSFDGGKTWVETGKLIYTRKEDN